MIEIPIRIESEANLREHHQRRARRARDHRRAAFYTLHGQPKPELPCTVVLTRIGRRDLDDDNLAGGFKACRDGIAQWLGIDDADPRVSWRYAQRRDPSRYSAEVEFHTQQNAGALGTP